MTFYAAAATEHHAILAVDDSVTTLAANGKGIAHDEPKNKLRRVGPGVIATGSGDSALLDGLFRHLAEGPHQQVCPSDFSRWLARAYETYFARYADRDSRVSLLFGGVGHSGRAFFWEAASPSFNVTERGPGTRILAPIAEEELLDVGMDRVMQDLDEAERRHGEDAMVQVYAKSLTQIVRRIASIRPESVTPTGHLAIVGPHGIVIEPFGANHAAGAEACAVNA